MNVVKALKWWRNETLPNLKHPKGFPLERIIGECCPDDIESVAEGVAKTLEAAAERFAIVRAAEGVPELPDYGVPTHNVLKRIDGTSFATLYDAMVKAAETAKAAREAESSTTACACGATSSGRYFRRPLRAVAAPRGDTRRATKSRSLPPSASRERSGAVERPTSRATRARRCSRASPP